MVVGTGDFIEIVSTDNHVRFRKPPLNIRTTFEELESSLEPLIHKTFEEKDSSSSPEERTEAIKSVQKKIEKKGVGYDVKGLYNSK